MPMIGACSALSVAPKCCHSQEGGTSPFDDLPLLFLPEVENKTPLNSNLLQPFKTPGHQHLTQARFGFRPLRRGYGIKEKLGGKSLPASHRVILEETANQTVKLPETGV